MCGRFTYLYNWQQLERLMQLAAKVDALDIHLSYNVAPSQFAPVVRQNSQGERTASMLRWGQIPSWAKDENIASQCTIARSEEAASKPSYCAALKTRRCLIPISGFYEWQKLDGQKIKQPWAIRVRDVPLFAVAGLWERWEGGPEPVETFAMMTMAPNELMATIHDRMPVIIRPEHYDLWLDPKRESTKDLAQAMTQFPSAEMEMHRVSTRVNKPTNNDASLLEEIAGTNPHPSLFG